MHPPKSSTGGLVTFKLVNSISWQPKTTNVSRRLFPVYFHFIVHDHHSSPLMPPRPSFHFERKVKCLLVGYICSKLLNFVFGYVKDKWITINCNDRLMFVWIMFSSLIKKTMIFFWDNLLKQFRFIIFVNFWSLWKKNTFI